MFSYFCDRLILFYCDETISPSRQHGAAMHTASRFLLERGRNGVRILVQHYGRHHTDMGGRSAKHRQFPKRLRLASRPFGRLAYRYANGRACGSKRHHAQGDKRKRYGREPHRYLNADFKRRETDNKRQARNFRLHPSGTTFLFSRLGRRRNRSKFLYRHPQRQAAHPRKRLVD